MKRFLPLITILVSIALAGGGYFLLFAANQAPEQPIAFSHQLHAGTNQIDCAFCHRYARRSTVAGMPSVESCKGCHIIIAAQRPEVQKLMAFWNQQKPIPWVKVYDLPDHVYFSHKRHLLADIECRTCHGDVAGMDQVRLAVDLKMGWCLNCHRQREAGTDCWTCHN